ncbi:unnamed protein product [Didymodactylos carnosus]|uniref:Dephospho-CoA kinase n=1 Tax=Didymodactylos carnosus TaxID=1234261 RepID=A0A814HE30_9BILA|nr:unnamed protein product [Didymodactylos carnosus]CAF1008909.1 unnamed protein product [Didymodactylos carnosus]CAF3551026.1 unnamed protein product [Didymodactylos carnosus]CAF3781052.1 unnamed protein product [Didymodactylos carnosus]
MLILGLTGGIATGKSIASQYFHLQGIPIIDADRIARQVVQPGLPAYKKVLKKFGHLNIIDNTSKMIDRKRLGDIIFSDENLRRQLNQCTHSYIRRESLKQLLYFFFCGYSIIVWDIPLLFEVGLNRYLSNTVVIYCDENTQKQRLKQRDQLNDEQATKRIKAQLNLDKKCQLAKYRIDNSNSEDMTHTQLENLLSTILPSKLITTFWYILLFIPAVLLRCVLTIWDIFDKIKS